VADELMGNYKELEDRIIRTDTNSEGAENFITPIGDEIRWMVFKVKQKAKTNYYDALRGKAAEKAAVEIPDYTHNWPYDFCSVVELAKLDVEVELGRPEDEGISGSPILKGQASELIPPGSALSAASSAASDAGSGGGIVNPPVDGGGGGGGTSAGGPPGGGGAGGNAGGTIGPGVLGTDILEDLDDGYNETAQAGSAGLGGLSTHGNTGDTF
jgi:hypothetical protein